MMKITVMPSLFLQTCLKESDGSDTEDFGSDHSEDCLSEASWEPVDKKETEVCPCKYGYLRKPLCSPISQR